MDEKQHIQTERQEPTFYARVPKMAITDLDPYELALYCNYKQTASDAGGCTKSNATLAEETGMSISKLKLARKALEEKGFIRVERRTDESGVENQTILVTIVDIWAENHQRFSKGSHVVTGGSHMVTGGQSHGDRGAVTTRPQRRTKQEEPNKKNQDEDDPSVVDANYAEAAKVYENEIGLLSRFVGEQLKDLLAEYPKDWVIDAVRVAVSANKRNLNYMRGCLRNWKAEGRNGAPSKPDQTQTSAKTTTPTPPITLGVAARVRAAREKKEEGS